MKTKQRKRKQKTREQEQDIRTRKDYTDEFFNEGEGTKNKLWLDNILG